MAKTRMINTRFWSDGFIREKLNPLDRYLYLYFLTNDKTNISGIYELPLSIISSETGIETKTILDMLERFKGKVGYKDGWVILVNFLKYQNIKSFKIQDGIEKCLKEAPKDIIEYACGIGYGYGIDTVCIPPEELELESQLELESEKGETSSPTYQKIETTYKTKKDILKRKGITLKPKKRTDKQQAVTDGLLLIDYFKEKAQNIHGLHYLQKQDSARNKKVLKLFIEAGKEIDGKAMVDWWLDGEGEWCKYEPDNIFTERNIEKFKNNKIKKQDGFKKRW